MPGDESKVTCEKCGYAAATSARYCVKCGHQLPPHPDQPEPRPQPETLDMVIMKKLLEGTKDVRQLYTDHGLQLWPRGHVHPTGLNMDPDDDAKLKRLKELNDALKAAEKESRGKGAGKKK